MNRSESKYFHTAICMDEAFLSILGKKDFAYITVKEICERAGVNRSTFYLHYEDVNDLLNESIQYMYDQFLSYMKDHSVEEELVMRLQDCSVSDLYFITPKYLTPYLSYMNSINVCSRQPWKMQPYCNWKIPMAKCFAMYSLQF